MASRTRKARGKTVETLRHADASRTNIPTAEYQSVMRDEDKSPIQLAYERRNRDLDPQLVWRGKDEQDWSDLMVQAPPLYIQEKVHPKVLIDDLVRQSRKPAPGGQVQLDLFADFNGIPEGADKTDFYQHGANWSNRMILGDSLQVMASLAEREGLRGQVQCIYIDPPYGIKFNSNFQWSTTDKDVKDGRADHITREPEQVKAFRDTWRDGIHSYLTYLRDRLTVTRDLLSQSGSVFIQIGDENVHRVRSVVDEVFGDDNFLAQITYRTSVPLRSKGLAGISDYILWYAKDARQAKFRDTFREREVGEGSVYTSVEDRKTLLRRKMSADERRQSDALQEEYRIYCTENLVSSGYTPTCIFPIEFRGDVFSPTSNKSWKTNRDGVERLVKAERLDASGRTLRYMLFFDDYPIMKQTNLWTDMKGESDKTYVVQTSAKAIERCIQMASDPGDLVLDPTCGSGTTAYVAEQWGRRWITIDTSRVALALARARIMGARYQYYLLSDSREGQLKEAEVGRTEPSSQPVRGDIRHGFVCQRAPHVTIGSIAHNTEIDVIWDRFEEQLDQVRSDLGQTLAKTWKEWEIPRNADLDWSPRANELHSKWWELRIARQKEIDASIAAKADFVYLYDKPYEDNSKVRVAGPFTVESLQPHRMLGVDEDGELIDTVREASAKYGTMQSFPQMVLENLRMAGVQQAHKEDKIYFTSLVPWPGELVCAEGRYLEGDEKSSTQKRAAISIGPEFGTVSRPDLVAAAREAGDAGFDVLIPCAFNYAAHSSEFKKLGRIPVLKARMNADLHMAKDLKNAGKGNLFVIFGEPDIEISDASDGQVQIKVIGVDVFHPNTGEVRSEGADGIACWFIDTDYNEESFFVRQAYFLGANDPYKALKTTLKAEINEEAWESLHSDLSRPFDKPPSGRIAVKVINHLGDEVMKVFRVS